MNVEKQIEYWLKAARSDLEVAGMIFDSGKGLHYCLFLCHLVLEKGLKAVYVRRNEKIPPRIHDLESLAEKANLTISRKDKDFLSAMTTFNLEARYPDEQFKIYKRATKRYTERMFSKTMNVIQWLEKLARQ
jgi:HEPN domain-containing protein